MARRWGNHITVVGLNIDAGTNIGEGGCGTSIREIKISGPGPGPGL